MANVLAREYISLSEMTFIYMNKIKKIPVDIFTTQDVALFIELKKIERYDSESVNCFFDIFQYSAIGFYSLNKHILLFIEIIKSHGVKIYFIKENPLWKDYVETNISSALDIILVSDEKEKYCEKLKLTELIQIIEWLWSYKQISGKDLTYHEYMYGSVNCLMGLQNEGFEGFLQSVNSKWEQDFHDIVKEKNCCKIITTEEEIKSGKRYIIDIKDFCTSLIGNFIIFPINYFLRYICENTLYKMIRKRCNNVYICNVEFFSSYLQHHERNRYNYLVNRNDFPENFTNDICGKNESYLSKVIKDKEGCQIIKLNEAYIKYLSNYHSEYFNTDLYGNRIVTNCPKKYTGTIWLIGRCFFSGYAVEDKCTVPSFLQEYINLSGYKYRVVDLSCEGGNNHFYNKLLEKKFSPSDIVVIQAATLFLVENLININYKEIDDYLNGRIWYWNQPIHMGFAGNAFCAKKIFRSIESAIDKFAVNHKFYLEDNLKFEIEQYLEDIIRKNKAYNCLNSEIHKDDMQKIGAIVMNQCRLVKP